ncbi:hypothetical protein BU25DRAFT_459747 [Macroventuria anomochaeta]|uniref:Uncharacterized protein n=1 Tax=Macroventuria anomochaeta TaxID=301207 RepID=A0ACB6RVX6_9PLEO|nr:uncharacterized protein BU25DRAFT_459747 [Macroventuria anomochaeta]KAF2626211.1 hypothetical protein BU25DRAFT_459747 [Macroventuria anomochaeta]
MPSSTSPKSDPYIMYGRGGAGNFHHRSTIRSAWKSIKNSPSTSPPLTLSVSPDNYYAAWNAKSEDPSKKKRESQLASSMNDDGEGSLKRNASSGSLSLFKSDSVKRNTSSGSLFSLSSSTTHSRSHNGLSGLSKIFGRRSSVEDDRSVSAASTVESVREEEDGDAMVMKSSKDKGKARAQE